MNSIIKIRSVAVWITGAVHSESCLKHSRIRFAFDASCLKSIEIKKAQLDDDNNNNSYSISTCVPSSLGRFCSNSRTSQVSLNSGKIFEASVVIKSIVFTSDEDCLLTFGN